MMPKQPWEIALGEPTQNPQDGDELMKDTISETKRQRIIRREQIEKVKDEAELAKYQKQVRTAEAPVEKTESKESTGFKVTGGIDVGHIDLQAREQQAQQELKELKEKQEGNIKALGQENEQLRDKIHEQEMKVLEIGFKSQMDLLTKAIESNASKGSITEQLAGIRALAKEMGMTQPVLGISDPALQIQILGLQHAEALRERQFEWDMVKHKEDLELQREKNKDEKVLKQQELAQEAEKAKVWQSIPEALLRIGGKAYLDSAEPKVGAEARELQPGYLVPLGEAGEADCIKCGGPVAIGPTARAVVCAGCGARYPIKRVKPEITKPQPEATETPAEEE